MSGDFDGYLCTSWTAGGEAKKKQWAATVDGEKGFIINEKVVWVYRIKEQDYLAKVRGFGIEYGKLSSANQYVRKKCLQLS